MEYHFVSADSLRSIYRKCAAEIISTLSITTYFITYVHRFILLKLWKTSDLYFVIFSTRLCGVESWLENKFYSYTCKQRAKQSTVIAQRTRQT